GYPWLDTVSHEFVHYLVTQKGRNTVPIWLQEGLAKFLETRWRGAPGMAVDEMSLSLLQDAAKKGKLIPFAKMHPSIAMLPTQEQAALAFAEVEAAIRLLYQRGGQSALTELVSAMAAGDAAARAAVCLLRDADGPVRRGGGGAAKRRRTGPRRRGGAGAVRAGVVEARSTGQGARCARQRNCRGSLRPRSARHLPGSREGTQGSGARRAGAQGAGAGGGTLR